MGNACSVDEDSSDDEVSAAISSYVKDMGKQWKKILKDPKKLVDAAASKRSPFKFDRLDAAGKIELNIGVSAVALADAHTDFGRRYAAVIDRIQDLWGECLGAACRRQTTPHMSIGAIVLDKNSPNEYNAAIAQRRGLFARVKAQLDAINPPPRAKIQTLKINPDGCVTFQLDSDPSQDVVMTASQLDAALSKVPTCSGDKAMADERGKYKKNDDGTFQVSRFQQIRLALGALGCEIKGMYPSGHMVVVNLMDPKLMADVPKEDLDDLWAECYEEWYPLTAEWFELKQIVCLCYVERSLNEGNAVTAPRPGMQPRAFPETNASAQGLLGGVFTSDAIGDVYIDEGRFTARRNDRARGMWQAFRGEAREEAENETGVSDFHGQVEQELHSVFNVFDLDGSGTITTNELRQAMETLGEELTNEEAGEMIRRADKDGGGNIDYREFVEMMMEQE